jgi:hypothetical protein
MNNCQACRDLILAHKAEIFCLESFNMAMLKLPWPTAAQLFFCKSVKG